MKSNSTTACPICNGLSSFDLSCPACGQSLTDNGRYMDFFGDYSPYRPIEDAKLTDGLVDAATHQCPHYTTCTVCDYEGVQLIQEIMY